MYRSKGDMASPRHYIWLLATMNFIALCSAGPLGPLPNVTSSDLGLKEGSCAVGDVVYLPGDEFPGSNACERCTCTGGGVRCAKQRCEPRPGCKALHRPDHCCPTYQCECEQEGRVYGNGEKLVDPADPCRVCYCQGGEVVCRRIACFVRDDCRPRLVPGRCCPEYDNCPLRGVTTIPGVAPSISSILTIDDAGISAVPAVPKENIKQEITIKEITPVSEIPVITDVKIKEVLPSSSMEVVEYASSKSPLIPREATSEKTISDDLDVYSKTEPVSVIDVKSSSSPISISSLSPEAPTKSSESFSELKTTDDSLPSKISFSTQDSINSEIYPSNIPNVATMGSPSVTPDIAPVISTTKAPVIEEEDPSLFDHNPAFPPLPDDLSVLSNHDDEIVPENIDSEHIAGVPEIIHVATAAPATEAPIVKEIITTTTTAKIPDTTVITEKSSDTSADFTTAKVDITTSFESSRKKGSPMLNLRSAIPTEILNAPSSVSEDITGELDDVTETTSTADELIPISTSTTTESAIKSEVNYTDETESILEEKTTASVIAKINATTSKFAVTTEFPSSSQDQQDKTTSSIAKSNVATEVTSQTELSSLPIETSNQNPPKNFDNIGTEKDITSTADPVMSESSTKFLPSSPEIITISTTGLSSVDNQAFENVETTEIILTSFGSGESVTDAVELIKITADSTDKSAPIIEPVEGNKNNVLTDLINLVGDVASISDHTEGPESSHHSTSPTGISESEELIPVNAGYKSKNNNWNLNSITEIPSKTKSQTPVNKQKIIEIEDDETDSITDSPPPYDRVEPTTRRPIIDNVSDVMPENKTEKKDIEIITQSYVPTINRRPTKVVMKKNNEKQVSEETSTDDTPVSISSEAATETSVAASSEASTSSVEVSSEAGERIVKEASSTTAQ